MCYNYSRLFVLHFVKNSLLADKNSRNHRNSTFRKNKFPESPEKMRNDKPELLESIIELVCSRPPASWFRHNDQIERKMKLNFTRLNLACTVGLSHPPMSVRQCSAVIGPK